MARGIKDKVAILGMGCSKFGERWDSGAEELMLEAYKECLEDAGHRPEAAPGGVVLDRHRRGACRQVGHPAVSTTLRLPNIPVTHVENMCASGTEAFRGACYAVASGAADFALALGRREAQGHRLRRSARRPRRSAAGAVERQRHGAGQLRPARHRLHDRARRLAATTSRRRSATSRGRATRTAPRTRRPICRRPSRWTPS